MTTLADLKPLLFVAMPFGKKRDATLQNEIDFDHIYHAAIEPAGRAAGLEVIRADEERYGGIIHGAMFERLLLAEVVIADVTIPNANVFYELGVRHCARPRSTILIRAREGHLPFDVSMIRAISYELQNGFLGEASADDLRGILQEKLGSALEDLETKDSPLFQLITQFPGIQLSHEVTETFRDRARSSDAIRDELAHARIAQDRLAAAARIRAIEESIRAGGLLPTELLVDVVLSYRDVSAWGEMIRLISELPPAIQMFPTLQQQLALALNRRNNGDDRAQAIRVIERVIARCGPDPESCGILGRIHKDQWQTELERNAARASGHLDRAIHAYREGFEADPRDPYPGINLATLLTLRAKPEAEAELATVLPAVAFAVSRRGGIQAKDYWDVATALEVAVLARDWHTAQRASEMLLASTPPRWVLETAARNLRLLTNPIADSELRLIITTLEAN